MEENQDIDIDEFSFKELFIILNRYKWSIFLITIISMTLGLIYIYFNPTVYSSYAIIKVKPYIKTKPEDLINNTIATKSKDVTEEITLLKTFNINQHVLKEVDFSVQYFIEKQYKKTEIYNNIPIKIKNIKILNNEIIGKKLILIPQKEGFILKYVNSYKKQIENKFFQTKLFSLEHNRTFKYGEKIINKYFTLTIDKKSDINTPIYFVLNGEAREIFEKIIKPNLNINQLEKDTSLIKISYIDNISTRAQLYVNALSKKFIELSISNKNKHNTKTLKFIVHELNKIGKELKESEKKLERYQVSKSIVKPSIQGSILIKKLSNIEIEISENNLKKRLIRNLINFVENNYNLDAIAPSLSKLKDQNTLQLITKLQEHQLEEEELTLEYTDKHPKLKSLRKQILNIRNKIKFNLKNLKTNISYQNSNLIKRKKSYEDKLKKLPSQERHLINIKRSYEVKSKMYEYLLKKEAENKIIQFATLSDYQIIDSAYNFNKPTKNKNSLILLMSIFVGFIFSLILALLRNSLNNGIQNQEDIKKLTTLPIHGTIPFYKQKKYQLKVATDPKSPFTEGFRTLRTNLQFIKKSDSATTILITSTIANEGKTTISANLAKILEMAQYKTLLINLDIRKPTLHNFFDIDNSIGIVNYLDGTLNATEIIRQTEFGTLDIITSGPIPENPSELILSKRLPVLLDRLKTMYDYIIIDTAPIGIVSDTKTIMKYTDLNLILLKENFAKKDFISIIEKMIIQYKFQNIGIILNASKEIGGEYGYGYSYEYK